MVAAGQGASWYVLQTAHDLHAGQSTSRQICPEVRMGERWSDDDDGSSEEGAYVVNSHLWCWICYMR